MGQSLSRVLPIHCGGHHLLCQRNKSGPAFWGIALGRDQSGRDMWHLEKSQHVSLFFSQRFPVPLPSFLGGMGLLLNLPLGREQNWAGVGRDSSGVAATPGGQFLLELRTVKLARPSPGTSQRADHCGQGCAHKLITCQKGEKEAIKEHTLRKANPIAKWSPWTIHSTPTDTNELSVRDSCFQPSLGLCSHGSLFSNVPPFHVCLFWSCSSSKVYLLHIFCVPF